MKRNNSRLFNSIEDILTNVVGKLGVDRGLKEVTLVNLWPDIIGFKFKDHTRLVSVVKNKEKDALLVAVKNPVISQELTMFKNDIIKKIYPVSKNLGFNINDIIFSTKMWYQDNKIEQSEIDKKIKNVKEYKKEPTQEELDEIEVPESIINSTKEALEYHKDFEIQERMFELILKDIKTQIWRKNNGFPFCEKCGIPMTTKEDIQLCPSCRYGKN